MHCKTIDVYFNFVGKAEAKEKYGEDKLKIYRSAFTPMYHSVTQRKVKAFVKLICLLPDEKVCIS